MKKLATAFLLAFAFSSLAQAQAQEVQPSHAEIVKAADWNKMETVTVEMSEHEFSPRNLSFKANQPYRLVIRNNGEKDHYYTATEFFKSVAWRKAQTPRPSGGEFKAPYFTAVEAYKKGGSVELFFVPVKKGSFEVICTIEDHKDQGMLGAITVE